MHESTAETYDVVIVGASLAGCAAALEMAGKGLRVLVLEKREATKSKACSGVLVRNAERWFEGSLPSVDVFAYPGRVDIRYLDWTRDRSVPSDKQFLDSHRNKLDRWLRNSVETAGVDVRYGVVFCGFEQDDDGVTIAYETRSTSRGSLPPCVSMAPGRSRVIVRARALIGCDGAGSRVAQGVEPRTAPEYIGMQELVRGWVVDEAMFVFDDDLTDYYAWVIPKDGETEIGMLVPAAASCDRLAPLKRRLADKLGVACDDTHSFHSSLVLRPRTPDDLKFGSRRVLLCGEAAALVSPSSAEGISYALWSGRLCAQALLADPDFALPTYKRLMSGLVERLAEKMAKADELTSLGRLAV